MIGIFDSGSGGLTVARAIRARAPRVDLVYFGDIENVPYGSKDPDTLKLLTFRAFELLRDAGADVIVTACNSISAAVIVPLFDLFGKKFSRVIEMVQPATAALRTSSHTASAIVIVATPATVASGMYQRACAEAGLDVHMIANQYLAELVEFGAADGAIQEQTDAIVRDAMLRHADTLMLGCTHYPLVRGAFEQSIAASGRPIALFDPADAVAQAALSVHGSKGMGRAQFIISKDSKSFRERVHEIFGSSEINSIPIAQGMH